MTGKRARVVAASAAVIAGLGVPLSSTFGRPFLLDGASPGEAARLLAWSLVVAAPWLVGAWLVLRRPRLGTAVLITSAVLAAPAVVLTLVHTFTGAVGWIPWWLPVQLLLWAAMVVAAGAAWSGRPRGGWRGHGEVPTWLLAPIVLASLPVVAPDFATVGFGGGPAGGWLATHLTAIGSLTEVLAVLLPLVVVVLGVIVLFRLRRRVAGAVLLAAAGPQLVRRLSGLVEVAGQAEFRVMPAGVAALVGGAILVAVGIVWLLGDDAMAMSEGPTERSLPVG
jgi:hypothetical protein